jgi:hypothetical protein
MTLTVTVDDKWFDGQRIHVVGSVLASVNYATGGDTVDFSGADVKSAQPPSDVRFTGVAGYVYGWTKGTLISNQLMTAHEAGADAAALDEVAAGAYPAALIADVIRFHAIFKSR